MRGCECLPQFKSSPALVYPSSPPSFSRISLLTGQDKWECINHETVAFTIKGLAINSFEECLECKEHTVITSEMLFKYLHASMYLYYANTGSEDG